MGRNIYEIEHFNGRSCCLTPVFVHCQSLHKSVIIRSPFCSWEILGISFEMEQNDFGTKGEQTLVVALLHSEKEDPEFSLSSEEFEKFLQMMRNGSHFVSEEKIPEHVMDVFRSQVTFFLSC